jgi:hypothetical protein
VNVITIDMNASRWWGDCSMCDQERRLDHAVGWYCEPVPENPGETHVLPNGEAVTVGGMRVCKPCHDSFYATRQ